MVQVVDYQSDFKNKFNLIIKKSKMKKVKLTTAIITMLILSLTAMSCNKNEKSSTDNSSKTKQENISNKSNGSSQTSGKEVVADYMVLKDALVSSNKDAAAKAGATMETSLNYFDLSKYTAQQQKDLKDIITDAKENAEHISKSEIDHQREHFKLLTKDITDMIAITGADGKVYQMNCPMYDGGSNWLSASKEVKNPYLGSKMMTCGTMQKELN